MVWKFVRDWALVNAHLSSLQNFDHIPNIDMPQACASNFTKTKETQTANFGDYIVCVICSVEIISFKCTSTAVGSLGSSLTISSPICHNNNIMIMPNMFPLTNHALNIS